MAEATVNDEKFNEQRRLLALECTWEIGALLGIMRDMTDELGGGHDDQETLMTMRLQLRGLIARTKDLDLAVMAILDDDRSTAELTRLVHGRLPAHEVGIREEALHG